MDFAIIGLDRSIYARTILEKMSHYNLRPKYVLIEDSNPISLASSSALIDTGRFPTVQQSIRDWGIDLDDPSSIKTYCYKNTIPFYTVQDQNSKDVCTILTTWGIDILLITEGPIIRGPILYLPRYCVMNIHAAPLPQYRGNWTTRLALYNDEPPFVSAHAVTPWIDAGPILKKMSYQIKLGDTLEDVDCKALQASAELAVYTIYDIIEKGFQPIPQNIWDGREYKGSTRDGITQPAMPLGLQEELRDRFRKGEYGFYAK